MSKRFLPGIALGGFLLWLLTFPMEGILPGMDRHPHLFLYYLFSHGLSLLILAFFLSKELLNKTLLPALGVTMGATLAFPYFTEYQHILTVTAGTSSAWLMIKAGVMLKNCQAPFFNAALGLLLGNTLLLVAAILSLGNAHYLLITLCILPMALKEGDKPDENKKNITKYLPLIFIFYMVSGLMYGYLDVLYSSAAVMPGLEVSFYVFTVIAGGLLVRVNPAAALAFSIALSMLSLSFMQSVEPTHINTSMYLKQASKGFLDIFVFSLMLSHARPIFSFGLTAGLICMALSLGSLISMFLSDLVLYTVVIGNIALAGGMILFFFVHKLQVQETPELTELNQEDQARLVCTDCNSLVTNNDYQTLDEVAPRPLLGRLSEREKEVLEMTLLKRMMFRQVAEEAGISESSVKTYMHRIYEKAGVKNKKGLQELLLPNKKK